MKILTNAMMTMGQCAVHSESTTQRLNTRISNESEFMGADNEMSQLIWSRYFIESQGYHLNENIIYQDNERAI